MKAFKFSLQAVLDNANNIKDECSLRLKEALDNLRAVEHLKDLHIKMLKDNEAKLLKDCNSITFREIKIYMEELAVKIEQMNKEIEKLTTIKDQRLEELKQAKINCSAYEKIREKKYSLYLEEIRKYEEKQIEELINYNYIAKAEQ